MQNTKWETPQDFFDRLNAEFAFSVDVCADPGNTKCIKYFTPSVDGLSQEWQGVCWMNPPYDRSLPKWIHKAYASAQHGATVVCLLRAGSSDTVWFHEYIMHSSEIRFIKNRLHFGSNGKFSRANIASMLVVFKPFCKGPPRVSSITTKADTLNQEFKSDEAA